MPESASFSNDPLSDGIGAPLDARIAALRMRGAEHVAPVYFRFIEALARRAQEYQGDARCLIERRLEDALADCGEHCGHAQAGLASRANPLGGEPAGNQQHTLLAGLVSSLTPSAPERADDRSVAPDWSDGARTELKALRYFRGTWSKLSVDQQLASALAQGPENAGPLNSHQLVLRSLKLMRDISPEYLNRFMSYADALLWLDQAVGSGASMDKKPPRSDSDKKPKAGRSK